MADRPIIFSAPMVRALLDGRKTQTRRVLTPRPGAQAQWLSAELLHSSPSCYLATVDGQLGAQMQHPLAGSMRNGIAIDAMSPLTWIRLPYAPGDRLWVREAHYMTDDGESSFAVFAENEASVAEHLRDMQTVMACHPGIDWSKHLRLHPSIHMPRWASRITLTVTDVRVQRLQEISEADAVAEGVEGDDYGAWLCYASEPKSQTHWADPRESYRTLWDSIHGPSAWDANPWVAAYTFTVHRCNIDQMEADHG